MIALLEVGARGFEEIFDRLNVRFTNVCCREIGRFQAELGSLVAPLQDDTLELGAVGALFWIAIDHQHCFGPWIDIDADGVADLWRNVEAFDVRQYTCCVL